MSFFKNLRSLPVAFLTAGFLATAIVPAAQAQEISPEHLSVARQYIDMTDRGQVFEQSLLELGLASMRQIIQQNPDLEEPVIPAVETVINYYIENKDDLYNQFARIYASRFTQEELTEIVTFYEGATGQKLLAQNQAINVDLTRVLQVWEGNARTEFFSRVRSEMRAAGHEL
jgi:uncharacterized protein